MTPNTLLFGLGAGLISAIVFVSATTGPVLARFAFFFLTPISLYLAGLGLGPLAAAVAAAAATVIMAEISPAPSPSRIVFGVMSAVPHLAVRDGSGITPSRPNEWGGLGNRQNRQ